MANLLNAQQFAHFLGISYGTLRNIMSNKPESLPPFIMVGRSKRWRECDIEAFYNKGVTG